MRKERGADPGQEEGRPLGSHNPRHSDNRQTLGLRVGLQIFKAASSLGPSAMQMKVWSFPLYQNHAVLCAVFPAEPSLFGPL